MTSIINASTTAGVIITPDTSGNLAFQSAGSNTITVPPVAGTMMVSGNIPTFSAWSSTTQNPTSAVATKVILNNKEWDTANAFDSTTNYRFTPQVAGYYQIDAMLRWTSAGAASDVWIALYKNGSVYKRANELGSLNAQQNGQIVLSEMVSLNGSTDYIELYGLIQGTSISFDNSNGQPYNARMAGFLVRTT